MPETSSIPAGAAGTVATASQVSPVVTLRQVRVATAWNLQGDAGNSEFAALAASWLGQDLPRAPNSTVATPTWEALWLSPKSWLLLSDTACEPEEFRARRDQCNAAGGALFDISASRVAFEVSGPGGVDLLEVFCPVDLHPSKLGPGSCAQSLFGHVAALYHSPAPDVWRVFVARSFGRDAWASLCETGKRHGATVLAD